jgi:hypothetical protein
MPPQVIYYASKTLMDTQVNYTTMEKELLAMVFALDKSVHISNHAALRHLLAKKETKLQLI